MLIQAGTTIEVRAAKPGLHEITRDVSDWLDSQRIGTGLLTLFCAHTSASLLIQENAAPAARADLEAYFERIRYAGPREKRCRAAPTTARSR